MTERTSTDSLAFLPAQPKLEVPPRPPKRSSQPVGNHFTSPKRRRATAKDTSLVYHPGQEIRLAKALSRLKNLQRGNSKPEAPPSVQCLDDSGAALNDSEVALDDPIVLEVDKPSRRKLPDETTERLYANWQSLLPSLVDPLLAFMSSSYGHSNPPPTNFDHICPIGTCQIIENEIVCLYWNYFTTVKVGHCRCTSLCQNLVSNGLFPTAPLHPRTAVSTPLLDLYFALFERSADAVSAMASALRTLYDRRGFPVLNSKGEPIRDAFRRGLGYAIQWYDCLRIKIERRVEDAMNGARYQIEHLATVQETPARGSKDGPRLSTTSEAPSRCAQLLQNRCPCCFGGSKFGIALEFGGDIHVAADATFSQRHNVSAGECPTFYDPEYFISKEQVDRVGKRIEAARKKPPKQTYKPRAPDAAVDECEKVHEAADEKKEKTSGEKYDDRGLMALLCRHDIVLFYANVDTPGEQQKYVIALVEHLFSFLPPNATVGGLYDIGCSTQRSIDKYDILPEHIANRLVWATSIMHAYGHQWSCQLAYNPRLREGFGLTDGEGCERHWSRNRYLIGVTRTSARSRRIWILDRHAKVVNQELRSDLGIWIRRRLKTSINARSIKANEILSTCGISVDVLRQEWASQRAAQLSVRAHAPARLKKELDLVLNLQGDLDVVDKALETTRKVITQSAAPKEALDSLTSLERTHARLADKVEALYASLNIHDKFPELKEVSLEFVRLLLMARDLKINIRKRAIGSFFEWDRLDQAVGGRDQALGTKLHQQTRKAIAKRTPALVRAIRKFNKYCDSLKALYQPSWNIPLPDPLPSELSILRSDPALLADVWVTQIHGDTPRWLDDVQVRRGIRAMLEIDRCNEEKVRLITEAENMTHWYGDELAALEIALRDPTNAPFIFLLDRIKENHLRLKHRWKNVNMSISTFEAQEQVSEDIVRRIFGPNAMIESPRIHVPTLNESDVLELDPSEDECADDDLDDMPDILHVDQYLLQDFLADEDDNMSDVDDPPVADEPLLVDFAWMLPDDLQSDTVNDYNSEVFTSEDVREACKSLPRLGVEDLMRLSTTGEMLNDTCINHCALLLQSLPFAVAAEQCALFNTYLISSLRHNVDDDYLWRVSKHTSFWRKQIWIIPIHDAVRMHWTVCVLDRTLQRILYSDSLARQSSWKQDVTDILEVFFRLEGRAIQEGKIMTRASKTWLARPTMSLAMQTNSYDCGLWVLASILAIFRGSDVTSMVETNVSAFRAYLVGLAS